MCCSTALSWVAESVCTGGYDMTPHYGNDPYYTPGYPTYVPPPTPYMPYYPPPPTPYYPVRYYVCQGSLRYGHLCSVVWYLIPFNNFFTHCPPKQPACTIPNHGSDHIFSGHICSYFRSNYLFSGHICSIFSPHSLLPHSDHGISCCSYLPDASLPDPGLPNSCRLSDPGLPNTGLPNTGLP